MLIPIRSLTAAALLTTSLTMAAPVTAQPAPRTERDDQAPAGAERVEGTVVSVRRGSFTMRTSSGRFRVFALDRARPARPLRTGMRVAVMTRADGDADEPVVLAIAVLPDEPGGPGPDAAPGAGAAAADPVPPEVRAMEDTIERQLRRYNAGIVGGVSVDPELIIVGGHVTFERVFRRSISFPPGVQLGFGEVSTLLALEGDVLYAWPGSTRRTRWAPYVGAGPTIAFRHRSFEGEEDDGTRFDFGDTDAEHGFNFIVGMRNRTGAFVELKATASGVSDVRLLAGVTF